VHKAVIQITAPSLSGEDEEWAFAATLISNAFHPLNQWGIKELKIAFYKNVFAVEANKKCY
jgi:hypothetical protein